MNFIQVVGSIKSLPDKVAVKGYDSVSELTLEVKQNFVSLQNNLVTDLFKIQLWRGMSDKIISACKLDDVVSIKGRVEVQDSQYRIIAEHIEILG